MTKQHYNPETKKIGRCDANKQDCPLVKDFGEEAQHFQTIKEAKEWIVEKEDKEHGGAFGEGSKLSKPAPRQLSNEEFREMAVEVDNEMSKIYKEELKLQHNAESAMRSLHIIAGDPGSAYYGFKWTDKETLEKSRELAKEKSYNGNQAEHMIKRLDNINKRIEEIKEQFEILNKKFKKAGGWNRAFLASSSNGHVHKTMDCSTCNNGNYETNFEWMTDFSAMDEDEIVTAAGYRACTNCYPSAPVGSPGTLPTKMFSEDEKKKQKDREEREAKKDKAKQDRIAKGLTADGSPFEFTYINKNAPGWDKNNEGKSIHVYKDRSKSESFKTERSAVQWYVDTYTYNYQVEDKKPGLEAIEKAIAEKYNRSIEEVKAELDKKIATKKKKEGKY